MKQHRRPNWLNYSNDTPLQLNAWSEGPSIGKSIEELQSSTTPKTWKVQYNTCLIQSVKLKKRCCTFKMMVHLHLVSPTKKRTKGKKTETKTSQLEGGIKLAVAGIPKAHKEKKIAYFIGGKPLWITRIYNNWLDHIWFQLLAKVLLPAHNQLSGCLDFFFLGGGGSDSLHSQKYISG